MAEEKVGLKSDAEDAQGVYPDIQDEAMKKQMDRLNFLDMMDEIYIQQPFRGKEYCLQCCLCWEVKNEYKAFRANKDTKDTTPIFTLTEESDCFFRVCCPSTVRPFTLRAVISEGNEDAGTEIFRLERPYRCGCCCCAPTSGCAGLSIMEVYIGDRCIGTVQEDCVWCNCKVNFSVHDSENRELCALQRFCCVCDCLKTGFDIMVDGQESDGKITKEYVGLVKELFTKNDNFKVKWPKQFNTRESKVLLIAAAMLLEYRFFEGDQN